MFPISKNKLSFREISDYWSREIQPPASQLELLGLLEEAWWLGEVRGDSAKSRLQLLQAMFNSMHDRNDLGILFVLGEDTGPPNATELPDGCVEVDVRRRIIVPSGDTSTWDEHSCVDAFHTLAQTSSTVFYPEIAPGLTYIELTYGEFNNWCRKRGYPEPTFWQPTSVQLEKPKRGRPAEYNWLGVRDRLAAYVSNNGPVQTREELLSLCADFAIELHPKNSVPSDKTIREAIQKHALEVVAGVVSGK
jgi:hypothetical protein